MAQRHKDAIAIQGGACNPIAVSKALMKAIEAVREEQGLTNMVAIEHDPAIRLICHQLAHILGVLNFTDWDKCVNECERISGEKLS